MLNPKTSVTWGTDPEAFFMRDGQVIGSERIIPEYGIFTRDQVNKIVRDGVQFEFNPGVGDSVFELAHNISDSFNVLELTMAKHNPVSLCFDTVVEVSREELDSLSPATRVLGCMPSHNLYGIKPITVDPIAYRKRSSGGHIHMGLTVPIFNRFNGNPDERNRLVPLMDIFVGNTAVLLDRDPGANERRENYGRAGEYRTPRHGLEYRTTSNFWLRDFTLMSFVFGMANIAIAVLQETLTKSNDIENELIEIVNINNIETAINNNDFDLALTNFEALRPFFMKHLPKEGFPISPANLDTFVSFAQEVRRLGIEAYFPTENIVENWRHKRYTEFAAFLNRR